jgi:hypothetical protein
VISIYLLQDLGLGAAEGEHQRLIFRSAGASEQGERSEAQRSHAQDLC